MGRLYNRTPESFAWMAEPWTCAKCSRTMKMAGKGSHSLWCGVDPAKKFWPKVDRSGGSEACWPWTGARVPAGGYGRFKWTRLIAAHRFAYFLANGELPADLDIMHSCDNPPCCNPKHLRAATTAENMADCKAKGRRNNAHTPIEKLLNPHLSKRVRRDS